MNQKQNTISSQKGELSSYGYPELVDRVFDRLITENNLAGKGKNTKILILPPKITRVGTKRVLFENFPEICKIIHRDPQHARLFILMELQAKGSIDDKGRFLIYGRFKEEHFIRIIKRYISQFVVCKQCNSIKTEISCEKRLAILQCNDCNASRSIEKLLN
tara:strand:+ start:97 stop:579 length:483 start_codon:yes stop_codon:yes gene_type:complete